jgi:hypothetical protein
MPRRLLDFTPYGGTVSVLAQASGRREDQVLKLADHLDHIVIHRGEGSQYIEDVQRSGAVNIRVLRFLLLLVLSGTSCWAEATRPQSLLEFHNGFWINLHHFLHCEAQSSPPSTVRSSMKLDSADREELGTLSNTERADWDAAVSYYATSLVRRDLLMDSGMEEISLVDQDCERSSCTIFIKS